MALFLTTNYFRMNVKRMYDMLQSKNPNDGPFASGSIETLMKIDVYAIESEYLIYASLPEPNFMGVLVSVHN